MSNAEGKSSSSYVSSDSYFSMTCSGIPSPFDSAFRNRDKKITFCCSFRDSDSASDGVAISC